MMAVDALKEIHAAEQKAAQIIVDAQAEARKLKTSAAQNGESDLEAQIIKAQKVADEKLKEAIDQSRARASVRTEQVRNEISNLQKQSAPLIGQAVEIILGRVVGD